MRMCASVFPTAWALTACALCIDSRANPRNDAIYKLRLGREIC